MPNDYVAVLADLKHRIARAQARAALSVSRELVALYWHVGATIVRRQAAGQWGDAVVERLAHDLRRAFPKLEGFSVRNIWRMRAFFLAWSGAARKLPQAVAEIPWGHNILLLEQLRGREERLWYAERTRENGWSRSVLRARIATKVHARQGRATTNFARSLAPLQADLAQQTLKDPYTFDFRDLSKPIGVAEWETKIVDRLPVEFEGSLPTVEEIEAELAKHGV